MKDQYGNHITPKQAAKIALYPILNLGATAWEDELTDRDIAYTDRERVLIEDQVTKIVDRIIKKYL